MIVDHAAAATWAADLERRFANLSEFVEHQANRVTNAEAKLERLQFFAVDLGTNLDDVTTRVIALEKRPAMRTKESTMAQMDFENRLTALEMFRMLYKDHDSYLLNLAKRLRAEDTTQCEQGDCCLP